MNTRVKGFNVLHVELWLVSRSESVLEGQNLMSSFDSVLKGQNLMSSSESVLKDQNLMSSFESVLKGQNLMSSFESVLKGQNQSYYSIHVSIYIKIPEMTIGKGWDISVGRASDQNAWLNTDADLSAATDFLPVSTFNADSLILKVSVQPLCAIVHINICKHIKNPKHWQPYQPYHCVNT